MKLEQLIVQYLYTSKKVTIQDIGSFTIAPDVVLPTENDKDATLPPGAISFEFDLRAAHDEDLISFITQQTRKIRPLAASDLESYSILSKQFLNLGKPLTIEGLGTLQKNQSGVYEFTQGQFVNARLESAPARVIEKDSEEISFRSPERKSGSSVKKGGMIALLLLLVLVAAAAIFYILYKKKEKPAEAALPVTTDTVAVAKPAPVNMDTSTLKTTADTTAKVTPATPVVPNEAYDFKVVIKEYSSKEAADKAFARLTRYGHKLILSPIDSVRYKISMPFKTGLADTTRAKDSLRIFFQSKTYIELK
ncbi:hypothetical protein [Ferruginibacter sp. HRS2-29]|uniref:hypothetical protein n=1 Tax=Ferruginibacter sp. HRS2-29 TaxID=2487334 RepID=UPI0020CF5F90|nr:hypothetical protein [Ferruginibacter sp. HRS2-29]MCP9753097.1 hypothetical protein [Ferruginibacter sp. HRS2-29]